MAFSAKPVMGLPKANGRVLFFQGLDHGHVVLGFGSIVESTSRHAERLTRLTLAHSMVFDHELNQHAFFVRRQSFFATASLSASCTRLKSANIRFRREFSS